MIRPSFFATQDQMRNRSKTVTRRKPGGRVYVPGQRLLPIVKGQGLKKGERQQVLVPPIELVSVRSEPLNAITPEDVVLEGFPGMMPEEFIRDVYLKMSGGPVDQVTTRLEFFHDALWSCEEGCGSLRYDFWPDDDYACCPFCGGENLRYPSPGVER